MVLQWQCYGSLHSMIKQVTSFSFGLAKRTLRLSYAWRNITTTSKREKTNHVWVSLSTNIYENLALEDWLYRHLDLQQQNLLLLWQNSPCVVIGRHQNPWVECDIVTAANQGIKVARRNSGGGTVYHDLGNMCMTFFTSRDLYNRVENLRFVASVLQKHYNLDVHLNARDDLTLQGKYKISGTAAKLGGKKSYHHCTLLLNVDCSMLHQVLNSRLEIGIESKATESVRSKVKNLQEIDPSINYEDLVLALTQEYLRRSSSQGDVRYIAQPILEDEFPGINKIKTDLASWKWIYEKTPKFVMNITLQVPNYNSKDLALDLKITVDRGTIFHIEVMNTTFSVSSEVLDLLANSLIGVKFEKTNILEILENYSSRGLSNESLNILDSLHQYFNEVFS